MITSTFAQRLQWEAANTAPLSSITFPAALGIAFILSQGIADAPQLAQAIVLQMTPGSVIDQSLQIRSHGDSYADQYNALLRECRRVFDEVQQSSDLDSDYKAIIFARISDAYI